MKLRHLAARPRCELVVFEAVPPFRGIGVGLDQPVLTRDGAQQAREQIATRYLGGERGKRFAVERATAGMLLRLPADAAKSWDLTAICRRNFRPGLCTPGLRVIGVLPGPLLSVVLGFGFCRWASAKTVHQPGSVVPVHPRRGDVLQIGEGADRPGAEWEPSRTHSVLYSRRCAVSRTACLTEGFR